MQKNKWVAYVMTAALFFSGSVVALAADSGEKETAIVLADSGVKVEGKTASTSSSEAVYTGADIVYYESGKDSSYGEGSESDAHEVDEAKAHTVVTITEPGTYRISGTLSKGQLAIDLGDDAKENPDAVVTLILDGVDITCTVAPAVIFYNVYECGSSETATATSDVDTAEAGANVIVADGSVNKVDGSYVARIYKEGTTKKLHKYDGAFYSKMSMNVGGETMGTGELHITAANEGLDSELHLTIDGGRIYIEAQDDGINTNEDFVSVTTINGGYLYINAGLGSEGDGIDSNGYLVINGGTIVTLANGKSGDGGLDADSDILLNGGTVAAAGSRNDAGSSDSKQAFMELSYAATKSGGTIIRIEDEGGNELLTFAPLKDYQSFTFTSPQLEWNQTYYVYAGGTVTGADAENGRYESGGTYTGGTQQQYTGNRFGMGMGGGPGMGGGMGGQRPDDLNGSQRPDETDRQMPEGSEGGTRGRREGQMPDGFDGQPPEGMEGQSPGGMNGQRSDMANDQTAVEGSIEFKITDTIHSFSGVSDAEDASGKTAVTFSINGGKGISNVAAGGTVILSEIQAVEKKSGETAEVPESDIQITITDVPSENFAKTCMLSDGTAAMTEILPTEDGTYQLSISIAGSNETYTGTALMRFSIGTAAFDDVKTNRWYYEAVKYVTENSLFAGTSTTTFSPDDSMSRGMTITVLYRAAGATGGGSSAFSDVKDSAWYSDATAWAAERRIASGTSPDLFEPDADITREQLAVLIYNYAKQQGLDITAAGDLSIFTDGDQVSSYAEEALSWAVGAGLISGKENNVLDPKATATRAEAAVIMKQFLS